MTQKIVDAEVTKDFPKTLSEVLTTSTTVMNNDAKVVLVALVYAWAKNKDTRGMGVLVQDLAISLGSPLGDIQEAARQLHKMDYLDLQGGKMRLIVGHPVLEFADFFAVPGLSMEKIPELVENDGKLKAPKKKTPKKLAPKS